MEQILKIIVLLLCTIIMVLVVWHIVHSKSHIWIKKSTESQKNLGQRDVAGKLGEMIQNGEFSDDKDTNARSHVWNLNN